MLLDGQFKIVVTEPVAVTTNVVDADVLLNDDDK